MKEVKFLELGPLLLKRYRELGERFYREVDWAWAIQDSGHTAIFKNAFERDDFSVLYLLVCGPKDSMNVIEAKRFFWRSNNILLNGKPAACLTYDELLDYFVATLEAVKP